MLNLAYRDKDWLNIIMPKAIICICIAYVTNSISVKGLRLKFHLSSRDSRINASAFNYLARLLSWLEVECRFLEVALSANREFFDLFLGTLLRLHSFGR